MSYSKDRMFGLSIERPILDHHPKAHVHEIRRISWNPADFTMKSSRFHHEIWRISGEIHEIWRISPLKSGGFHLWNPADFTQISPVKSTQNYKSKCFSKNSSVWWMQGGGFPPLKSSGFHPEIWWISPVKSGRFHLWNPPKIIKASVLAKTLQFDECRVGAMTKDFMKSTRFHPEVWWISPMKSGRFHPDLTCEIHPKL